MRCAKYFNTAASFCTKAISRLLRGKPAVSLKILLIQTHTIVKACSNGPNRNGIACIDLNNSLLLNRRDIFDSGAYTILLKFGMFSTEIMQMPILLQDITPRDRPVPPVPQRIFRECIISSLRRLVENLTCRTWTHISTKTIKTGWIEFSRFF